MRQITEHQINPLNQALLLEAADVADSSGGKAPVSYFVTTPPTSPSDKPAVQFELKFQDGALPQAGVNGITNEVLLAVVIDRLRSFEAGPFSCWENREALHHAAKALYWLAARSKDRAQRQVEGKYVK